MIHDIHEWLLHWARWALRDHDAGIGYPRQVVEAELIRMGGVLIHGDGGTKPSPVDEDAEEAERAVRAMPEPMRSAVRLRYLDNDTRESKAARLSVLAGRVITVRVYTRMTEEGQAWLQGWRVANRAKRARA